MALNIPLPGQPFDSFLKGANTTSGMMQRAIANQLQQQQMQQAWKQHMQNLAIRQQQEKRAADLHPFAISAAENQQKLFPYQLESMQAQTESARALANTRKRKMDFMEQLFGGGLGPQGMQSPVGGGGYTPEQIAAAKALYGIDLNIETPEMKKQRELDTFQQKEDYKNEQKKNLDRTIPTESTRTANQKVITSVNTVLPVLDDLMKEEVPGTIGGFFQRDKSSASNALTNLAVDELMTIFNLPKDQHSTKLAEEMVRRQFGESLPAYRKRLNSLKQRVVHRRQSALELLEGGKVKSEDSHSQSSSKKRFNPETGEIE